MTLHFSDRAEEHRRLGFDSREADLERDLAEDRARELCPADDPPVRCEECGGRYSYGSISACLGCRGVGWV